MSTNIITDFQINNNLTITDNNLKIMTDGTTDTLDISGNVDVSNNLIIRGYIGIKTETPVVSIDISANDALRLPMGNNSSRPDYTSVDCSGCIRYNTETKQFEGFSPSGQSWIGLGGVINIAQTTYITAEETTGENKLRFYTAGGQQMLINEYGNVGIGLALTDDPAYILDINSTGAIRIPIGTDDERNNITNTAGLIRYNSSNNEFEGYSTAWGGLGGVKTPTGNTKITADDTNGLEFFTNETEKMTILANGDVGIGTTSPSYKLEVSDGTDGRIYASGQIYSGNSLRAPTYFVDDYIKNTSDNNTKFGFPANYTIAFYTNNGERMRIDQYGNVGIGQQILESGDKLEVFKQDGEASIGIRSDSGTASNRSAVLYFGCGYNSSNRRKQVGIFCTPSYAAHSSGNTGNAHLDFCINSSSSWGDDGEGPHATISDSKMRIHSNGNVGIGTDSPIGKLHIEVSEPREEGFYISNSDATLGSDSNGGVFHFNHYNHASDTTKRGLILQERNTTNVWKRNIMTWQRGTGNVGIGTDSPQEALDVDGSILIRATTSEDDGGSPYYTGGRGIFFRPNYTPNGTGHLYNASITAHAHDGSHADGICIAGYDGISFRVGASSSIEGERMRITTSNVRCTGDIIAYYSDERLKTFKGKITEPLAKIKQINGYYFVENELAKSLGYDNDKLQVGVSAQEVEKVLPEIVTKAPIDHEYKTIWYQKLTPLLIEGMKEQQTQIEKQQTQIEKQQTQIQSLQEQINELKALISK